MKIKTYPFDVAEHLKDDEDIAAFISLVIEEAVLCSSCHYI